MKKRILLATAMFGLVMGAGAQIQFNKNSTQTGLTGKNVLENGNYSFMMNFNTNKAPGEKISDGNGKGFYGFGITNEGVNGGKADLISSDHKVEHPGSNAKALRWADVPTLLTNTTVADAPAYSDGHTFWKYGNIFFDVPGSQGADQAYAVWPGMAKRTLFGFRVKVDGGLKSDISFDLMTLDPGNTGATATVKMIAQIGSTNMNNPDVAKLDMVTAENVAEVFGNGYYVIDNLYTSVTEGLGKTTFNLAELLGIDKAKFNGKQVTVNLYIGTDGTAMNPGKYGPIIGLDNITGEYGLAKFLYPVIEDMWWNNGTTGNLKVDTINVLATPDVEEEIVFRLKSVDRTSTFEIKCDGDNRYNTSFYFKETGSVMGNDGNGNYTVPVTYEYTPTNDAGTVSGKIVLPADPNGQPLNDDIEVKYYVKFPKGQRIMWLEITNGGERFRRDIIVKLQDPDAVAADKSNELTVTSENRTVYVTNAAEEVSILSSSGQHLTTVSAEEAAKGITMERGVYLVKVGETTQKAFVK